MIRAAILLVLAMASLAHGDAKRATQLFDQAKALERAGNFVKACELYDASLAADPTAFGTKMNVGDCAERQGRVHKAHTIFLEAADDFARTKDPREKYARDRAQALMPRLVQIILVMPDPRPPGIQIRMNDRTPAEASEIRQLFDPGIVDIEVTAPEHIKFARRVTLVAGQTENVKVVLPAIPKPVEPTRTTVTRRRPGSVFAATLFAGAGAVSLVTTIVVGLKAKSDYDGAVDSDDCIREPMLVCNQTGHDRIADAQSLANVATGFGIATLLFGASAAVLYFTAPRETQIVLTPAPGGGGVSLGGHF